MYKVIEYFTDLQDRSRKYHAGDTFPREGLIVSKERLEELSTDKNRRGIPLIEKVDETEEQPTEQPTEETEEQTEEQPEAPKKRGRKRNADVGADS